MSAPVEAFDPQEFCRAFSIGKTTFYSELKAGRLRAVKAGRKTLVLKSDAQAWAASLPAIGKTP